MVEKGAGKEVREIEGEGFSHKEQMYSIFAETVLSRRAFIVSANDPMYTFIFLSRP